MTAPPSLDPSAAPAPGADPQAAVASPAAHDWQPLPLRGAWLAALGGGGMLGICVLIAAAIFGLSLHSRQTVLIGAGAAALGALLGACIGFVRHRRIRWRLDAQGLDLRRGRMWQSEVHVPMSRVQHLDLRRGPLERAARLATLIVHTAGTRHNAVAVPGLDQADAERLRERLAHQLDHDDDAL
ncbi:PH domain-containing protein [Xanthomonas translucens pv. graminis]|uniref:PH domain-containing protein n=1 Tax=Xanthomonas graminis TaxID=3390026 RepID=UPI002541926A|nr:PH domain-containing protein [Xanthomonas translucens]WIH05494.1 PH domain-containing protein [Xanthomonas translucens pv. graminis]